MNPDETPNPDHGFLDGLHAKVYKATKGDREKQTKDLVEGLKPSSDAITSLLERVQTIKGEKGDKGDKPSDEELTSLIEPLIPEPIQGDVGEAGKDSIVPGPKGENGKDGYTPIKGVDYFDGVDGGIGPIGKTGKPGKDGKDGDIKQVAKEIQPKIDKIQESVSFLPRTLDALFDTNLKGAIQGQVPTFDITTKKWIPSTPSAGSSLSLTTTGTSGAATYNTGTGVLNIPIYNTGGTPGGSTTQLQYNNAGVFGGMSRVTTNGNDLILTGQASPTYTQGKLVYDTDNESLTFYNNDSNISLQIGQESWIRVINNTGSTIPNGSSVYLSGASGGLPTIGLALASDSARTIGAGLTTESIANSAIGYVTSAGVVHGLDTSGFTAGQTVYISSSVAGGLVSTAPTAPNYRYRVGIVAVSDATVGSISVTPSTAALGNGTANQVFGINAAGTAQEVKSITSTTSITVVNAANSITMQRAALTGVVTASANSNTTAFGSFASLALATAVTDETGSGALVFGTAPTVTLASASTAVTQTPGDNSTKLATTAYVQAALFATQTIAAAKYATTAALTTTYSNGASGVGATLTEIALGALSVDGVTPSVNDRILVKNQASTFQNGVYTVTVVGSAGASYVLTRATDYNVSADINLGDTIFVSAGSTLASTTWTQNGTENPVMGTDPITFAQTAGAGSYTAGNGLSLSGTQFAINTAVTVDLTTAQSLTNKNLNSGTNTFPTFNQNTTGSAATLTTPRTIGIATGDVTSAGSTFDGSANNTNAYTLATVNSNVGSFTNANVTVNAKGLITAVSNGSGGSGITIGTTTITSGTTTKVLFDNAGVVGEYTISGTGNVAMTTSPVFTTPNIGSATGSITGNAGTVTNATLTTALTVNTGTLTLTANAANTSVLTIGAGASSISGSHSGTSSGTNTGDQTITLTGAVTGSGTGSFATTIATPGTLTVASTNSTATAHTHAITSSSAPGAAASLLATDASGIIGSTGTRIVKGWFTDLTVTNAIAGSITGNAATVTTNANLTGDVTSVGNATTIGALKVTTGMIAANAATLAKLDASNATANKVLMSGASASPTWSTPTFPNASATSGKMIKSDGTNWVASTETYAAPGTSGNVMTSDGTNWTSAAGGGVTAKTGVATRSTTAASSAQTIAHGLGKTPKLIRLSASYYQGGSANHHFTSFGAYDGTNQSCVWDILQGSLTNGNQLNGNSTTAAINLADDGGNSTPVAATTTGQTGIVTVDATNIIITWTLHGSGLGITVPFVWEALG